MGFIKFAIAVSFITLVFVLVLREVDKRQTVVKHKHKAIIFAAKVCSCYGDTKNIDYREKEFDFYCNDGVSYGKFIPYTMVYQGQNCVGNP